MIQQIFASPAQVILLITILVSLFGSFFYRKGWKQGYLSIPPGNYLFMRSSLLTNSLDFRTICISFRVILEVKDAIKKRDIEVYSYIEQAMQKAGSAIHTESAVWQEELKERVKGHLDQFLPGCIVCMADITVTSH